MASRPSFETFLNTVRFWFEHAGDQEVQALAALVREKLVRLGRPEWPEA